MSRIVEAGPDEIDVVFIVAHKNVGAFGCGLPVGGRLLNKFGDLRQLQGIAVRRHPIEVADVGRMRNARETDRRIRREKT